MQMDSQLIFCVLYLMFQACSFKSDYTKLVIGILLGSYYIIIICNNIAVLYGIKFL